MSYIFHYLGPEKLFIFHMGDKNLQFHSNIMVSIIFLSQLHTDMSVLSKSFCQLLEGDIILYWDMSVATGTLEVAHGKITETRHWGQRWHGTICWYKIDIDKLGYKFQWF